jgi:DNA repair exonuclease SbcCD nuclease subunit
MIQLLWRTDMHLSDRAPERRIDDWTETILGKVRQVGEHAKGFKASAVLDGGDFFHIKTPTSNPHSLVERAAKAHEEYPCPVYSCIGNHDAAHGDYTQVERNPLGVLFATGVFKRLYDEHEVTFRGEHYEWGPDDQDVPTVSNDILVRVVGIPYHGSDYDMERFRSIKRGDEDWLVVVAHVFASPQGGSMYGNEDVVKYADLADLDPDLWLFGHWHKDQGIQKIGDKVFVNTGSLSRGALTEDEFNREPVCVALEFSKEEMHYARVPLKVRPADEVFDFEGRVIERSKEMVVDDFVKKLQATLSGSSDQPLTEMIAGMENMRDVVRERAIGYVERAATAGGKK